MIPTTMCRRNCWEAVRGAERFSLQPPKAAGAAAGGASFALALDSAAPAKAELCRASSGATSTSSGEQ